ncbi:uncharacterized protein LOC114330529 isoform X2 [Diabrotica virgifera virgifera]|uniref:Phenoloxidase-activating factor 2 n=1 Tax=Diabrotica virgifera virgifera TaxID=50390 RepID=A0A6P7FSA9_DIAVI|nr:uncharacterized protein LOC114330529 isoform X2 [Diabrotica virgifera virgifera]
MRLLLAILALSVLHHTTAEEASWSWGSNDKDETPQKSSNEPLQETVPRSLKPSFLQDEEILIAEPSEYSEDIRANSTEAELVIDEILSSTKKGRAIDGFHEVYSDPNVQEALQKGDDSEARNVIKDRLCALGLMQCDGVEEKRPFYAPEELIYAQPVSINPVGKPIPTIPIKGHRGVGYGPPKPLHYPSRPLPPPGKFPPLSIPPNKFGPPSTYIQPGKPPRRQFAGPPTKPFYGKPGLNGEVYEGGEYIFSKPPPNFAGGLDFVQPIEPEIPPYKFEQGASQFGTHKDKRVEITVNAQGGHAAALGSSSAAKGTVEHVHHHYHHNLDNNNKPVIVNPAPLAAAAVTTSDLSSGTYGTHSFGSSGTYNSFKPSLPISPSTTAGLGNFGSSNGFLASNTFGSTNGFSQASYGGQPIANYGVKPITENYQDQGYESFGASVGSYGSTGLYKKELNLNSVNNNYLQANYADKYQGVESARAENYDCICVPYDQCPSHDVIGRKDDLYLPLDPRNLKSDIEALSDEERVITDGNGTMTVVTVNKDTGLTGTNVTEVMKEGKRISKRDTSEVDAKVNQNGGDGKPEARQFYGGNNLIGRPQTCGPRHVCCKRPLRPQVPHPNRQCGTRHSQGINGRIKNPVYVDGDSEFGEYPWQVAILKKDSKESVYVCGGTLIDPLHILTAAHCVKTYTGFDLRARLGEWDVNHDVEFYPYIERDVVSVHVHPEFYAGTLYNDIAILRMDKPVDWSKSPHISPACLPHPQDDYTGARCWTTGWGKDAFGDFGKYQNILKEVDVPIVDSGICQRQLQQTRLGYDFKLHPGFICAGGEEGKDACKGDGGGPMVCERGGTWQVVGLVSWGIGCGQTGVPGVYVKVGYYLDWIRQITQRY